MCVCVCVCVCVRETETETDRQTDRQREGGRQRVTGGGRGGRSIISGSTLVPIGACADLFVTGSHVTARVTVQNVWCSNGVIFIIDEILHLPTRTIAEELKRRPELKYGS